MISVQLLNKIVVHKVKTYCGLGLLKILIRISEGDKLTISSGKCDEKSSGDPFCT